MAITPITAFDPVAPLENLFNTGYTQIEAEIAAVLTDRAIKGYRWANAGGRGGQTGMVEGDIGVQLDTNTDYRYSGTAWIPWNSEAISYTPTIANISVGNGMLAASMRYSSGILVCQGRFVLGSTSTVTATPRITHPVTASAIDGQDNFPLGSTTYLDAGIASFMGFVQGVSSTTADFRTSLASGTYTAPGGLSNTVPFAWGTGDSMMWRYEIMPL